MIDPAQERLLAIKQSPITEHLDAFDRSMANNTPTAPARPNLFPMRLSLIMLSDLQRATIETACACAQRYASVE